MISLPALISDIGQRIVTLNKLEQRRYLLEALREAGVRRGASVLDFGCGPGLFAPTLLGAGLRYVGFDPDDGAARYAAHVHPRGRFVSRLEDAGAMAPYDIVLANCCFHHIDDQDLLATTLPSISRLMHHESTFMLVDVLPLDPAASIVRRLFNMLEQGSNKRTTAQLERLLAGRFVIRSRRVQRFFVLSAAVAANPVYNDIVRYELALA